MQLKERYVIIDYTNHDMMFIGDSLSEIKEWMLVHAEENEQNNNDIEEIKNLPLDRNTFFNYLDYNYCYHLYWQDNEEYTAD